MIKIFIRTIFQGNNPKILTIIIFLHIIIFGAAWLHTKPFFDGKPCAVCGRANTKPVNTLWQYKSNPVPYVMEKNIWYCKKHYGKAPEIVKEIPLKKDTVKKRFLITISTGSLILLALLYTLTLINLSFYLLFTHPAILGLSFLFFGITGNSTITIFFTSIVALPLLIFLSWNKWGLNKK